MPRPRSLANCDAYSVVNRELSPTESLEPEDIFRVFTQKHDVMVRRTEEHGHMLLIDGALQLSEVDQDIYHTLIVQPALTVAARTHRSKLNVLILGGGDGFALRKVLSHPQVNTVTLVDHDEEIVELFRGNQLAGIFDTQTGFRDPRVTVLITDAHQFLARPRTRAWHIIIVDLTDDWLGKSAALLRKLAQRDIPHGAIISMSAGPAGSTGGLQTKVVIGAGLRPICQWSPRLQSFGERWRFLLCATRSWRRYRDLKSSFPKIPPTWLA